MNQESYFRRAVRQIFVLIAVIGLTFAAGVEWAQAATGEPVNTAAGVAHVLFLFAATLGFVAYAARQSQRRVRARARRRVR